MPPSKKPTLALQVQVLKERVNDLEEKSRTFYKLVGLQLEWMKAMKKLIDELISSGIRPADDWRKQGEAQLEQDERERRQEQVIKRIHETQSKLLDVILDMNLALRNSSGSASSNETG